MKAIEGRGILNAIFKERKKTFEAGKFRRSNGMYIKVVARIWHNITWWSKQIHIRGDRASERNATASCFGKGISML